MKTLNIDKIEVHVIFNFGNKPRIPGKILPEF